MANITTQTIRVDLSTDIVKAATALTYNNVSYSAGDTILTSEVTS